MVISYHKPNGANYESSGHRCSGYIGSHTCVQLLQNGHDVIILDNLCNSKRSVLPVIERLGGKHPTFVEGDIRNEALMTEILHDHAIDT
ncbi:UDP-galactose-4-epimerase [Escherichia coli]|nr:UDP-galactose-4-epimerase [Escherichia coli]